MSGVDHMHYFKPGPYEPTLTSAHQEVCGEESGFRDTFDAFMGRLVDKGTPAEKRILFDIMQGTGSNPRAAVAAYRRFLNRGEECSKFSPGYERWTKIRDARPVAPGSLAELDGGGVASSNVVAIGTVPESADPRTLGLALLIPAEEAPLSPAGVPQLSRLGEIAFDLTGMHRFGDVFEVPADPSVETSAVTVVRGMDGYSASILVGGNYAGDVSLIDDYARRVGAIEDPHLLLAAWNDYIRDLSWRLREYASAVEDIAEAYDEARGNLSAKRPADTLFVVADAQGRVARAQATLRAILAASAAFGRPVASPITQTWEYTFLRAQLAKLNNFAGPILWWSQADSLEEVGSDLADLRRAISLFFDPFDLIQASYAIDPFIGRRIAVTLGEGRPGAPAANPVALRRIVDEIVYQAGLASPGGEQQGQLRVEWRSAIGELVFSDAGGGTPLFGAFQTRDGLPLEPLRLVSAQVIELGRGANLDLDVDETDGHITAIRVAVPLASVPPTPAGGGGAGGDSPSADGTGTPEASSSSPPTSASSFGGVDVVTREATGAQAADTDGASPDPWAILLTDPAFLGDAAAIPGVAAVPVPPASPVAP